ncbi:MAG: RNA polymerase subunit sigma-70, partial [Candidatus Eisenbacteria bacterium]|nr:RNA polymerase subunit sigma-70 [Candidatus Eisenbacteria bacterium]
ATLMERILKEHARRKGAQKRGGGFVRVSFDDGIAVVPGRDEDADTLYRALAELRALDPDLARVVDYSFAGLTQVEMAELLEVSERKVRADWAWARSWLRTKIASLEADVR